SSVSTESRWSGTPLSTAVSQVPQVPSAQDDSTPIPASSTTSRIDRSGGIVRVSSLAASSTSKASGRTGAVSGRAAKRSTCSDLAGQTGQRASTAASSGSGPQQYTSVSGCGVPSSASRSSSPVSSCGATVTRSPYRASSGKNAIDAR